MGVGKARYNFICRECAAMHNGKLPRKFVTLWAHRRCDVCDEVKDVISPKFFGLTNKLKLNVPKEDKHR